MINYRFKQNVRIADQIFKPGIRAVSEEIETHVDFLHFVKCGWIEEAPAQAVVPDAPAVNEHAKRLAARIQKKLDANQKKIKKTEPTPEQVQEDEEEFEPKAGADLTEEDLDNEEPVVEQLTPQQKAARTRAANAAAKAQEA